MNWIVSKGGTIVWLLAFLAVVVNAVLSQLNLRWLAGNEEQVRDTYAVLNELGALLSSVKDAETGQRGFVITGDREYLRPYDSALTEIRQHQERLRRLISNPTRLERLRDLEGLIDEKLKELQHIIDLRKQGNPAAAREIVLEGRGMQLMDRIRETVAQMDAEEEQLLRARAATSQVRRQIVVYTELFAAAATIAMTGIAYLVVRRQLRLRSEVEASLRQAWEQLEERVRQRTEELTVVNGALERSNRELEQFASVASHDLQEPLRKIQAFGDRLKTRCAPELGEQGQDYLTRIMAAATRMRRLIDDLLTFSRVSSRQAPFERVDLAEVAREVLSDLEGQLLQTGGQVELGELPTVDADPSQMRQLLQNLIGNGLKFHRSQEPPRIWISGRTLAQGDAAPAWCEIAVQDNGIGFDEVFRDRIFQMFQRLHGQGEYTGTGIGLAVCRKIVERHGGQITAHGTPGKGAAFIVTLPMHQTVEGTQHHVSQR